MVISSGVDLGGERPLQKIRWGTEALYFVTLRGAVIISRRGAVFRDAPGQRTARGARGVVFRDTLHTAVLHDMMWFI